MPSLWVVTAQVRRALFVAPFALVLAVACSSSSDGGPDASAGGSGGGGASASGGSGGDGGSGGSGGSGGIGGSGGDGGSGSGGIGGSGGDGGGGTTSATSGSGGGGGGPQSCSGACATTALDAAFEGKHRPFERAQLGTDDVAGEPPGLYIEAHFGGDPACPTETSPSPDRTLILSGVPRGAAGTTLTEADGLLLNYLEFSSDSSLPPIVKATAVTLTNIVEDPASPPAWFAADIEGTFAEGTIAGHLYATYCESLSW